jgi:hypothetical protein
MPNMPHDEFMALDANDKEKILGMKAVQYDIVCNGVELSSGAIRNHRPDVMKKAFAIAGYGEDVLEQKFGGMLRALQYGAPPHGGIAPGVDRIVMLLCGEENLREVVLFPMNQRAEDLLMGAPSEVTPKQLKELHIRLDLPKKECVCALTEKGPGRTGPFSSAAVHLPRRLSFSPPMAFCTLPAALSALPSLCNLASPVTLPAVSLIAPLACFAEPSMRSLSMPFAPIERGWKANVRIDVSFRAGQTAIFDRNSSRNGFW